VAGLWGGGGECGWKWVYVCVGGWLGVGVGVNVGGSGGGVRRGGECMCKRVSGWGCGSV